MQQVVDSASGVRLAELVASLSFATDLGRGLPMEHSIRRVLLALRLADHLAAAEDDRVATYYTGLLDGVYCHADADEQAMWFGDDIAIKAETYKADTESFRGVLLLLPRLGAGESGLARVRRIAEFPLRGWAQVNRWLGRLGVSNAIWDKPGPLTAAERERGRLHPYLTDRMLAGISALQPARVLAARHYERLDGSGYPGGVMASGLVGPRADHGRTTQP